MVFIIPEVLVAIADNADSRTIFALMLACRRFNEILGHHERSIVKGKLAAYYESAIDPRVLRDPARASQHPLLQLSHATVLTSDAALKRVVVRPYAYAIVKELEIRERRIQWLFSPGDSLVDRTAQYLAYNRPDLFAVERGRLLDSLRRACRISDILADCPAAVVASAGWIEGYNAHFDDGEHVRCRCRAWESDLDEARRLPNNGTTVLTWERADERVVMSKLSRCVRAAQSSLLTRLPTEDAVALAMLSEVAGVAYTTLVPGALRNWASNPVEKRTGFQECCLRRGAGLSLWALTALMGTTVLPDPLRFWQQVEKAVVSVLRELVLWETGSREHSILAHWVLVPAGAAAKRLVEAFNEAVVGSEVVGCEEKVPERDVESDGRWPVWVMQKGLQATLLRTLAEKGDTKCLTEVEGRFVKMMTLGI